MRKSVTITGIVLAVAILVSFVLYLNRVLPTTSETERRSGFDTSRFLVLLFPTQENEVCRRAVLASLDELERDSVELYDGDGVMAVPRDRFTATPSTEYLTQIERLNQTALLWGEQTDWSRVEWGCESSVQGITATLVLTDKVGTVCRYEYRIEGASVRPIREKVTRNIAKIKAN